MEIDFLAEAQSLASEMAALRQDIHRHPELGNRETRTATLVEDFLRRLGLETWRPVDTAVVGILQGNPAGPAVALRADMDALPVQEATGADFSSLTPGIMHACGHDVHTAAALGAAMILRNHQDALPGTVKFFFQPNEEDGGGAQRMIDAGCMEDVRAVFGAHVAPDLPLGTIGVRYGKFYAASDVFHVTVTGKSAHGALRDKGIDALGAAAEMVSAILLLPERILPERSVATVGTFHSGRVENVIADRAELSGILRSLGPETRREIKKLLGESVETVAEKFGAGVSVEIRQSYGGIVNTDPETALVQSVAEELLGGEHVHVITTPTMTSEDFGCFVDAAAGSFYHIGAGCTAPLHSADFLPLPETVPLAAALHAAVLWRFLTDAPR